MNADAKSRLHPAVAVLVAYVTGIVVGNVLWLPYTGGLAVAFILGGLVLALPLLAIAMLSASLARQQIAKRPALWCAWPLRSWLRCGPSSTIPSTALPLNG
ncbi:MAG: hypothetical protein IPG56_15440 [Caulobacteraceae bacterium]|nr:hypothetical protein [Caulobacteraceae bacterium]